MKNKKLSATVLTMSLFLVFGLIVHAELYTPGAWLSSSGTDAQLESWTTPNQWEDGGAGALFSMTVDISNPSMPIIRPVPVSGTIGIGHAWYETTLDTVIDFTFTTSTSPFYHYSINGEIHVTPNLPIYIAFKLGDRESSNPWDTYGWAVLMWDGANLNLLDSAAENSGTGIVAGQYQVVPEPSSVSLLLVGSGIFYLRKKKISQIG